MTALKLYNTTTGLWEFTTGAPGPSGVVTGTKLSALATITGALLATLDLIEVVDVSDTTMAASGTNKKITLAELVNYLNGVISAPAPADGTITPAKLANADFGDFTVASGVATIDGSAVTNTKLANMTGPSVKGLQSGTSTPADLGMSTLKTMLAYTPADIGIAASSETVSGTVELATAAETLTGTDNVRAVHPAGAFATFASKNVVVNAQTGTTYTLVLTDAGKLITLANASAITVTVPTNASVAFPIGTTIDLAQILAGKVTVGGAGVTINATPSLGFRAQWSSATLIKYLTDTWLLVGDLA